MIVGVPTESMRDERRVALVPRTLVLLERAGCEIIVEAGAGERAGYRDADYEAAGATIAARAELFKKAEAIVCVNTWPANADAPESELDELRDGQLVVGFAWPLDHPDRVQKLAERGVTGFALELIPRITRAQSMDALSSMATIAGYKAALLAANHLTRMFPMMITAAGTVKPARVFVIGAGVAGLQAIATSKRLGAEVSGYDVRSAVADQVRSVGGTFVELDLEAGDAEDAAGYAKEQGEDFLRRQRELMARVVADSDVVITTAAIPGRAAPVLITADMVEAMPAGSVVVDLAAARGGNVELTRAGEVVEHHGVTVLGPTDLASSIPDHASQMYARNVTRLLVHLLGDGVLDSDDDEIVNGSMMCRGGEVVHPRLRALLEA